MKEEFNPKESRAEDLRKIAEYIDTLQYLTELERAVLKNNIDYPGIQDRVLEIKHTFKETDPEAEHRARILLESLKNDIKDFPE